MRALSATLLAGQKLAHRPIDKLVLRSGSTVYGYTTADKRVMTLPFPHFESPYSQKANISLDNGDQTFSAIDFQGYTAEHSYGYRTGKVRTAWQSNTAYAVDDIVIPIIANGFQYRCKVAGTSAADTHVGLPAVDYQVGSSSDDVFLNWDNLGHVVNFLQLNDTDFQSGRDATIGYYDSLLGSGARYTNLIIPIGSSIWSAYLIIKCNFNRIGTVCNTQIIGNLEANPSTFSTATDFQNRRGTAIGGANNTKRTVAEVNWDAIAAWTNGVTYQSPDIKTVIQEMINQGGWASGNALALFWDDFAGRSSQDIANRAGYSYDGSPADSPILRISLTGSSHNEPTWPLTIGTTVVDNTITWEMDGVQGDEYSRTAPLKCLSGNLTNNMGKLTAKIEAVGVPDLMARDKAGVEYLPASTDTRTVKTLLTDVITKANWAATSWPHSSAESYSVIFDSEDSLIGSFIPADSFRVSLNQDRLEVIRWLISKTGCVMRVEADGKWHVRVPVVSGTTYDYTYSLVKGDHNFFAKGYERSIPLYGYIQVDSRNGDTPAYTGNATDTDTPTELRKPSYLKAKVTGDVQAAAIAAGQLKHYQIDAQKGSGTIPMNVGAEVYDYCNMVDSKEGTSRAGNIGQLIRYFGSINMSFHFGGIEAGSTLPSPDGTASVTDYYSSILDLYDNQKLLADAIQNIQTKGLLIDGEWTFDIGYDPTDKRRVFGATPTTPYDIGDLWVDASNTKRCTTARASGAYQAGDWTATTLDAITDGTSYARVPFADFSAGHILLSSTIKDANNRTVTDTEKGVYVGKSKVFRQTTTPASGMQAGDIWIDTTLDGGVEKGLPYTYDGTGWVAAYTYISGGYIKTGTIDCSLIIIQTAGSGIGSRVWLDTSGVHINGQSLDLLYLDSLRGYMYATNTLLEIAAVGGAGVLIQGDTNADVQVTALGTGRVQIYQMKTGYNDRTGVYTFGTVYQNESHAPLEVNISGHTITGGGTIYLYIGATNTPTTVAGYIFDVAGITFGVITKIIPVDWYYQLNRSVGTEGIDSWLETSLGI